MAPALRMTCVIREMLGKKNLAGGGGRGGCSLYPLLSSLSFLFSEFSIRLNSCVLFRKKKIIKILLFPFWGGTLSLASFLE
jgi:hypothetical protein